MKYLTRSAVALAALLLFWLVAPGSTVAGTTALQVAPAGGPPQSVRGSDGREHIAYNLVITNAFTADATLKSMVVRGGGERLLTLRGADLAFYTRPLGSEEPTTSVPKASAVVVYVDVALPRSAGRTVPRSLHHRISYKIPDDAPVHQIISSTTIDRPDLQVDRRPIEIAPPLRGDGWMNANGCCDPDLNHRSTMLTENGAYVSPETFAIDYIQVVDGRFYSGDGTRNSDWYGFGAGVHSVSEGKVVWAADRLPDVPPFINLPDNPTVNNPVQFCGNGVVIKMRKHVFGHYCHMQAGLGPGRGGTAGPDRAEARPARQQRQHLRGPPAFRAHRQPADTRLEQPAVRDRPLPPPGNRGAERHAGPAHGYRRAAQRGPGASVAQVGDRIRQRSVMRRLRRPFWSRRGNRP